MDKSILFTKVNTAELVDSEIQGVGDYQIKVKTSYSTISNGTEKANITGSDTVFCGEIDTLTIWELLSLDGVVITGYDRTVDRERTVMAYYKYYREVK